MDEAFGIKYSSTRVALHENNNFSIDSSCLINQMPMNSPNGDEGEITPTLQEDSGLSSPEALERFVEENLVIFYIFCLKFDFFFLYKYLKIYFLSF